MIEVVEPDIGECGTCGQVQDIGLCVVPNLRQAKMSWSVYHSGAAVFCTVCASAIEIPIEPKLLGSPTIAVVGPRG
jgi:hypothetical protein